MMKKTLLVIILLISEIALSAETEQNKDTGFTFSDLYYYKQPVKKGDDEKKAGLNISGGYIEKKGNTESLSTTYSFSLKYDDNIAELKITGSGSYGKLDGIVNDNRGSGIINFDYFLFWRIEFFSYTMSDYDKITELKHRNGSGCGMKIFILRNDYILIDLSGAPIFQYEKYEEQDATKKWRWSLRGRVEIFPFNDDFSIKYMTFYIPEMENKNNYRTIHEVTFYKKLIGALGIKAGYRREYNTYDEKAFIENPGLKKTDSTTYIQASLTL